MNKKVLTLSVAALLTMQNVAMAAQDRTEGIGQQAITTAQDNLATARAQIAALDQSLLQLSQSIQTRDEKGRLANAIAVGTAVSGFAILAGAGAVLHFSAVPDGFYRASYFLAAFVAASTVSVTAGAVSQIQKTSVDTDKADQELKNAQAEVAARLQQDPESQTLNDLNKVLTDARLSLKDYNKHKTIGSALRLSASSVQLTGLTMTIAEAVSSLNPLKLTLGIAIMSVGNLMTSVAGYTDEDAAAIQNEIQNTRNALASAQEKLK